jgi:hypothetical protein
MNIYRRYFKITTGPVIDVVEQAHGINKQAQTKYHDILLSIGAELTYYVQRGKLVGIIFKDTPDSGKYKELQNGGWWPKQNTKEGKQLQRIFREVETKDPNDALKEVGLSNDPCMFGCGRCYFPTLTCIPEDPLVIYITIPWKDVDPEELKAYKEDTNWRDCSLDFLSWEPSPDMVEVKEWEMQKHIDEWNNRGKTDETN